MQELISNGSYSKLIIHTPHAGTLLPIYSQGHPMGRWVRGKAIYPLHMQLTDHYTDKLFSAEAPIIKQITFPFSRLFCDVERLKDDPLEEKGLGICYDVERYIDKKPHSWSGAWSMTKEQAMMLYEAHHTALRLATLNGGLILDCHSFSEQNNILCPNAQDYKGIDICIGYNEDRSKPSDAIIELVANFFRAHGYVVEFNKPFSNAICTWNSHSLMLEINKHCYMDEGSLKITDGYYKLHNELQHLYDLLTYRI